MHKFYFLLLHFLGFLRPVQAWVPKIDKIVALSHPADPSSRKINNWYTHRLYKLRAYPFKKIEIFLFILGLAIFQNACKKLGPRLVFSITWFKGWAKGQVLDLQCRFRGFLNWKKLMTNPAKLSSRVWCNFFINICHKGLYWCWS